MFGTHRRGFDWKEIAEVLHITRAVARATFWRENQTLEVEKCRSPASGDCHPGRWKAKSILLNAVGTAVQGDS
jgi:hypothetical protein